MSFYSAVTASLLVSYVFIRMSYGYTQKRAGQRYAQGKQKAPSISVFRHLSKLLFVASMLLTLSSYWLSSPWLLVMHQSTILQLLGAAMVFFGYLGLMHSLQLLGKHYSPLFDAYAPHQLVTHGVYQRIRHPIYCFNLCVSFGLALSSGSALVLFNALIGLCFVLRAMQLEEAHLQTLFPQYAHYRQQTKRLLPLIY